MNRRSKMLVLVGGLLLVAIIATALVQKHNTPANSDADVTIADISPEPTPIVSITNHSDFASSLPSSGLQTVEQQLYARVAQYTKNPQSHYNGTIRSGSFNKVSIPYDGSDAASSIPGERYIVDIPAAQRSFLVDHSGGPGYPYDLLHVLCVPKDQLKYGDFGCVDEAQ